MQIKSFWVLAVILLVVCWAEFGQTQPQSFQIPPEIQVIINKAQNRQPLIKKDKMMMMMMMKEWSAGMNKGMLQKSSAVKKAQEASDTKKCLERKQIANLPTRVPELKEYRRFLTTLSSTYGSRNPSM